MLEYIPLPLFLHKLCERKTKVFLFFALFLLKFVVTLIMLIDNGTHA